MKEHGYYKGREQTYLKHFFLEKYLDRVAHKILSFQNDFVYVDGFSGPWKSNKTHKKRGAKEVFSYFAV